MYVIDRLNYLKNTPSEEKTYSGNWEALFINPTDAHNYKITGMLKQLKFPQLLRHVPVHSGTIIRELFGA